jgi:hypothetical protein
MLERTRTMAQPERATTRRQRPLPPRLGLRRIADAVASQRRSLDQRRSHQLAVAFACLQSPERIRPHGVP